MWLYSSSLGLNPLLKALDAQPERSRHEAMSVLAGDIAFTCKSIKRLIALKPVFDRYAACATLELGLH